MLSAAPAFAARLSRRCLRGKGRPGRRGGIVTPGRCETRAAASASSGQRAVPHSGEVRSGVPPPRRVLYPPLLVAKAVGGGQEETPDPGGSCLPAAGRRWVPAPISRCQGGRRERPSLCRRESLGHQNHLGTVRRADSGMQLRGSHSKVTGCDKGSCI